MSVYTVTARWRQQVLFLGDAFAALLAVWVGHITRAEFDAVWRQGPST